MKKGGLQLDQMDVIESNEAFAAQAIAVARGLELDMKKINPNGGAIALGHPIGCSGAVLATKALYELQRTGGRYALVTMCIGGGQLLEDDRLAVMTAGYYPNWRNMAELFAYTSAQELATRVSHRNAGKLTDDPVALELMKMIAADENHHFIFYKGVMTALLREAPSLALEGIYNAFSSFEMPGTVIPGFLRRSIDIAKAGVYNLRIHHDRVLQPLLRDWNIGTLGDLSAKAAEFQEKLMQLPQQIMTKAEKFEARFSTGSVARGLT